MNDPIYIAHQSQRGRIRERMIRVQRPERKRLIMAGLLRGLRNREIKTRLLEEGLIVTDWDLKRWVKYYREILNGEFVE